MSLRSAGLRQRESDRKGKKKGSDYCGTGEPPGGVASWSGDLRLPESRVGGSLRKERVRKRRIMKTKKLR